MMRWFRKHQRSVLIIITMVTIASFLFFGIPTTSNRVESLSEHDETEVMLSLLSCDRERVRRHFLETGLMTLVHGQLQDAGQRDFDERCRAYFQSKRVIPWETWFEAPFSASMMQWVGRLSQAAKDAGHMVVPQEVREEWKHRFAQVLGPPSSQHLEMLHELLLAYRLLEEVRESVIVDPSVHVEFAKFAHMRVEADVYELPSVMCCKTLNDFFKLELYLESVAPRIDSIDDVPTRFHTPHMVEARCPELVIYPYLMEVAQVSSQELRRRVTLKQMWAYQTSDVGWARLIERFPQLRTHREGSRLDIIDRLPDAVRRDVERCTRDEIVGAHPEWITEALAQAHPSSGVLEIPAKRGLPPFEGIEDTAQLRDRLDGAVVGEMQVFQLGDRHYRCTLREAPRPPRLMTLEEALRHGVMDRLLDAHLESRFSTIRKRDPEQYQDKAGKWLAFSEVKDRVGEVVYADRLQQLSQHVTHRFKPFMERVRRSVQEQGSHSIFLRNTGDPLLDQWVVKQSVHNIQRSQATPFEKGPLWSCREGMFSEVAVSSEGNVSFALIQQRLSGEEETSSGGALVAKEQLGLEHVRSFIERHFEAWSQRDL